MNFKDAMVAAPKSRVRRVAHSSAASTRLAPSRMPLSLYLVRFSIANWGRPAFTHGGLKMVATGVVDFTSLAAINRGSATR